MRHFISILLFFVVPVSIISCGQHDPVANASDYERYILLTGENGSLAKIEADISFWRDRFKKDYRDATALQKLAAGYATRFKLTGDISDIYLSDSLYNKCISDYALTSSSIYRSLAANSISRHEFWRAKKQVQQALAIGDNKASSLFILADILLELGNIDSAKIVLNTFTNKNSFAWLIRHAKVLDHEGDLSSAITTMEKALEIVKTNEELFCWAKSNLGDMYGHAGRVEDSYSAYLEVLRLKPDYDYALKGIAWIAFSNDKNTKESERILRNLMITKTVPDYYLLLADLEGFNNNGTARKKYIQRFKENIASPLYGNMYNRHLLSLNLDENANDETIQLAHREIAVRPTPESYDLLAWALYKNKRVDEAFQTASSYVEGKTFEPECLYHLGMIYSSTDPSKAHSYLEEALQSSFELGPLKVKEINLAIRSL